MPVPLVLITRLFQLITNRKITESERVLQRIIINMKEDFNKEFNYGYVRALEGVILACKSDKNSYCFFNNINFNDIGKLKKYHNVFLKNARKNLNADYDRGFFTALADYMNVILMTNKK
jgi:hypothetical protein